MARLKSEKYKGLIIRLKRIEDFDGYLAYQFFVLGKWMGTASTKTEAISRAKKVINRYLTKGY